MACFHPIKAYRGDTPGMPVAFSPSHNTPHRMELPCGQCSGCRLERSRVWALRCAHEASMHEENCFITLTYADDHIPPYGSLRKRDLQLFMKKLRRRFPKRKIRFFACGEYGDETERPHYHVLLFGLDFADKQFWKMTANGDRLYVSPLLEEIWGNGFAPLGSVTFKSAGYVARYVMKKRTKPSSKDKEVYKRQEEAYCAKYLRADPETGEAVWLEEEFNLMSRRPGIGKDWYDAWKSDAYPDDFVVIDGKKMKPPRYYDELIRIEDVELYEQLKRDRMLAIWEHHDNNSPSRLRVREECLEARITMLRREV